MNTTLKNAIRSFVSNDIKTDKARGAAIDLLQAEGYAWTDFISPKSEGSTATPEVYTELKEAVFAGFNKTDQALVNADIKGLSDDKKAARKKVQQQIGSKMKDLKNALKKRQEPEDTAPKAPVAPETKIAELINEAIKKVQQYEGDGLKDIPEMVAHLQAARNNIKG